MLTIAFIILKLTSSLLLSWWWIVFAILVDMIASVLHSKNSRQAYFAGYADGKSGTIEPEIDTEDEEEYSGFEY